MSKKNFIEKARRGQIISRFLVLAGETVFISHVCNFANNPDVYVEVTVKKLSRKKR